MIHCSCRGVVIALVLAGPALRAAAEEKVSIPAESRVSSGRYAEAIKLGAEARDSEAIEALQALIETGGQSLVTLDARHSVQARRAAAIELARLGRTRPAALRLYRRRVDEQAERRLKEALADRDNDLLRALAAEMFCSTAAIEALDRLGDRAFERGRFAEAVTWWQQLVPWPEIPAEARDQLALLVHPGPIPAARQARVVAKQLLARRFAGGDAAWSADFAAFRARHGQAAGKLAGRSGPYVDLLAALAREPLPVPGLHDWPTFAGTTERQHVVPGQEETVEQIAGLCRDGPAWKLDLEVRARLQRLLPPPDGNVPDSQQAHTLAFHPILLGSQLIVADACYVTAFDLHTGKSSEWYDASQVNGGLQANLHLPAPADLRYSLSAGPDCVYARLGVQGVRPEETRGAAEARPEQRADNESFLVCVAREPDATGNHARWCIRGLLHDAIFEGAPVVGHGNLYIASTRFRGERTLTSIDCFAADTPTEPPLRWRREVCNSRLPRADSPRYRHHLLTLAAGLVVCCSESGVILAVDAHTGEPRWSVRYPPAEEPGPDEPAPLHDLAPPLFAEGRFYVAPADSDRLLCLEPTTGRILWQRQGLSIVHLLGVGQGRLIFTTPEGLRAVGADDGSDGSGWMLPDAGGGLQPMGRGILVGEVVLWPTAQVRTPGFPPRRMVYAIRQRDGRPAEDAAQLHNLPAGNLLYANGCLVSCGPRAASVFVPPSWRLPARRNQALAHPRSPRAALALARAELDAGRDEMALKTLERARQLAAAEPGQPFLPAAQHQHEQLLRTCLVQAAHAGKLEEAETWSAQLEQVSGSIAERARSLLRVASLWEKTGHPTLALQAGRRLLASAELGDSLIRLEGSPARAADRVLAQWDRIRRESPEAFADAITQPASRLWEQTQAPDQAFCLRLAQEFPQTEPARAALRWLAQPARAAEHPGIAAQALRRLLTDPGPEDQPDQLRRRLDAVYLREHGLPDADSEPAPASLAPWLRGWHVMLPAGQTALPELPGGAGSDWLFTAGPGTDSPGQAACRSLKTGRERWSRTLALRPTGVACVADLVLLLADSGVACLRQDDGGAAWQLLLDDVAGDRLGNFQLAGGRLFFCSGPALLAVDALTGRVLWQETAPGSGLGLPFPHGRVFTGYHAGPRTVLVQTSGCRRLLDAASGRCLHQVAAPAEPWPRPVLALDELRWVVVADTHSVTQIDADTGQETWSCLLPGGSMLDGRPAQVMGRGRLLFLLVSTNIGSLLYRLDPHTGKQLWDDPVSLGLADLDLSAADLDERALYLARPGELLACSLEEPRILWKQPLSRAGSWQVRRHGEQLLAWPRPEPPARIGFRGVLGTVQWEIGPLRPGALSCPLECRDPHRGLLVQALHFQARPRTRLDAFWHARTYEPGLSLVLHLVCQDADANGPVLALRPRAACLALGAELWGLAPATR